MGSREVLEGVAGEVLHEFWIVLKDFWKSSGGVPGEVLDKFWNGSAQVLHRFCSGSGEVLQGFWRVSAKVLKGFPMGSAKSSGEVPGKVEINPISIPELPKPSRTMGKRPEPTCCNLSEKHSCLQSELDT